MRTLIGDGVVAAARASIGYVVGDATLPVGDDPAVIVHVCNDIGAWGAGFMLALSARDKRPEWAYKSRKDRKLGEIQIILDYAGDDSISVVNMIAQHGVGGPGPNIRYAWLWHCLEKVRNYAFNLGACVHMPRIGCGLGGGDWNVVEALIENTLCKGNVPVFVYDLK